MVRFNVDPGERGRGMLIAQISDPHIVARGEKAYGIAPTADYLRRCVEHINQQFPTPDLVLVTGDICNSGALEELEYAASLLEELRYPYYVIPGNHDDRMGIWATFGGRACPDRSQGFIQYVIDDYDLRFIALDTVVPGEPGGEICDLRTRWLDQRLSEDLQKPCVIFMHHPPLKCGVLETDQDGFEGAELLESVIKKYQHIERILCGHIHLASCAGWAGTVVSTAPSTGMQLVLDLSLQKASAFTLESPAYQLHYWTNQQHLVSHTVSVDNQQHDSYLFE